MSNDNPNKSTRFPPGVSGNKAGRPKGATNKWSLKKFEDELKKSRGLALKTIRTLLREEPNPNIKLKAALAVLNQDKIVQDMLYNEVMNDIKIERERLELEAKKKEIGKSKKNKKEVLAPVVDFSRKG